MAISRPGLMRSRDQRVIAGVCGGIAEWLGWSATTVRVVFFLVSALSAAFPGIIIYLILWIVMPERDEP
jgi:phage shock protein C